MNVLVTGAAGFLGSHIAATLRREGHRVRCSVRSANQAGSLRGFDVVPGDLGQAIIARRAVKRMQCIVHAAARLGGWGPKKLFLKDNVAATQEILAAAIDEGVEHLIYVSSATSYGLSPGVTLTESSPTVSEDDPYCETKLLCEELLRKAARETSLTTTVLRPAIIYGPGDTHFLKPVAGRIRAGKMIAIGARFGGPPLVYVDDVARFVAAIAGRQSSPFEIYNLAQPDGTSWEEIITWISATLGVPARIRRMPFRVAYDLGAVMEFLWRAARSRKPPLLTRFLAALLGIEYRIDSSKALAVPGFERFTTFGEAMRLSAPWILEGTKS